MSKVYILSGIPTSGKTTWSYEQIRKLCLKQGIVAVSRDVVRKRLFGDNYKQNNLDEILVTEEFNRELETWLYVAYEKDKTDQVENVVIIDNTSCKASYINSFIKTVLKKCPTAKIEVKFFDISLWKAFVRNIRRYLTTGKYIPWEVIKNMKKNYDKIDKKSYEYLVHE